MRTDAFFAKLPTATAAALAAAGFHTAMDLLLHFPRRHEDWQSSAAVADLRAGQTVVVEGDITDARVLPMRRRQLLATLTTAAGNRINLRFFNTTPGLEKSVHVGRRLRARGVVRPARGGWEMSHPRLQSQTARAEVAAVYPAIKGLTSAQMRRLISRALAQADLSPTAPPRDSFDGGGWTTAQALAAAHAPSAEDGESPLPEDHPAWRRLRFEELLAHQIVLRYRYHHRVETAPVLTPPPAREAAFFESLPFALTASQKRALAALRADVAMPRPMRRLLQGDVGSGKTVVAAYLCLRAAKCGHTAAFMAPTEILAEQHYRTLSAMFKSSRVNCELITGAITARERKSALQRLEFGIASVVVGTHALFQESLALPRLAVAVIDEQHRFGVRQRRALVGKGGGGVHQLMMSATPIPRTLALSVFADMDMSVLDEKPAGRQAVRTMLADGKRREEIMARVAGHVSGGGRAYWVCPLVEESEAANMEDVYTLAEDFRAAHPHIAARVLHGRMKAAEKKAVMDDFRAGRFGLLLATTVVEVGVDVAEANVMVIERADRLGLSQLHQLRGRVGRGGARGVCLLVYEPPLSETARRRLSVIRDSDDGFEIARQDMILRGPGEWLSNRQSGLPALRVARPYEDGDIAAAARETAEDMLKTDRRACVRHARRWLGGRIGRGADGNQ